VAAVGQTSGNPGIPVISRSGWRCRSNGLAAFRNSNIPERVRYFVVLWNG